MRTIAYQGIAGAFSHITALKAFADKGTFMGLTSFREVFSYVECGCADYGILPIENSVVGSIYEIYDLLDEYNVTIVSEHVTRIEHCLLTATDSNENTENILSTIKKVFSHPKALEQCARFFQAHPWIEKVVHIDTAAAAADIASLKNPSVAAIASSWAGQLYGLNLLLQGVEDDPKNYTRFVAISKKKHENFFPNKCSVIFQLPHIPGALANVLNRFGLHEVNLTKIESRPIKGKPFEYTFYLDFEFSKGNSQNLSRIIEEVKSHYTCKIKILGWYLKEASWTC